MAASSIAAQRSAPPQALITVSLIGVQSATDELIHSVNRSAGSSSRSSSVVSSGGHHRSTHQSPFRASATVRDPSTNLDISVELQSGPGAIPDHPEDADDVLVAVCLAGDAASVRQVHSRWYAARDSTPSWQPMCLVVGHTAAAGRHPLQHDASTGFASALRELDSKLDRDPRYYGCIHVHLGDDPEWVDSPSCSEALKILPPSHSPRKRAPRPRSVALSLPDALMQWVEFVKAPAHVVFDRRAEAFTDVGYQAIRRAFWLIDRDVNGSLSDAEILLWQNKMFAGATDDDIASVKEFLRSTAHSGGAALDSSNKAASVDAAASHHDSQAAVINSVSSVDIDRRAASLQQQAPSTPPRAAAAESSAAGGAPQPELLTPDGQVTPHGFMAVCFTMLQEGNASLVWAMLSDTGIQRDGLPYSAEQLARVPHRAATATTTVRTRRASTTTTGRHQPLDDEAPESAMVVHLSHSGSQFFGNLCSRKRFATWCDMWEFVPECPWLPISGLPPPSEDMTREEFVACWRAVTAVDPVTTAAFAFSWGYNSDAGLLFVAKPPRALRASDRDWPTTLRVLVVGSMRCGKTSLIRRMTGYDAVSRYGPVADPANHGDGAPQDADLLEEDERFAASVANRETTHILSLPRNGVQTTVLVHEIPEGAVDAVVADRAFMSRLDGVIVCFAASEEASIEFLLDYVPAFADEGAFPRLPVMLALTKADAPRVALHGREAEIAETLAKCGMTWCPFTTSTHDDVAHALGIDNDVDRMAVTVTEALHCFDATRIPRVTTGRKIRRAVVVGIGVALFALALKRLLSRAGKKGAS